MVRLLPLLLILPTIASAEGFITKKTQWDEMNEWAKDAFVAGYMDGFTTLTLEEDMNAFRLDLSKCIYELGLTTQSLVAIVNQEYTDLTKWDKEPDSVLLDGIRKVCLNKMNDYRGERGDMLLEP